MATREKVMFVGVDPGPETCGYAALYYSPDEKWPLRLAVAKDDADVESTMVTIAQRNWTMVSFASRSWPMPVEIAIEWPASYGMAVGEPVFRTCYNAGRIAQYVGPGLVELRTTADMKHELLGTRAAKRGDIRTAVREVIARANGLTSSTPAALKGTKAKPGPMYGISGGHAWDAVCVAVDLAWRRVLSKALRESQNPAPVS